MPWLGANGLLPGRGAPGRGPGRWPRSVPAAPAPPSRAAGAWGRAAGAGPGRGAAGRGEGAPGTAGCSGAAGWVGAAAAAGAMGAAGASAAGTTGTAGASGAGVCGRAGPGRTPGTGRTCEGAGAVGASGACGRDGAGDWGPDGAAGRATGAVVVGAAVVAPAEAGRAAGACGAGRAVRAAAPAPLPPPLAFSCSRSLRTTGGSTVDDADRTNSPSSWSLVMTTLLSTPSSLASSYTRTFATSLLSRPEPDRRGPSLQLGGAHRCVLIGCSSASDPLPSVTVDLGWGRPAARNSRTAVESSGPTRRRARGNARRRSARSRQDGSG